MTAARVLNPVVLSEFCKMRPSPTTVSRNLPCSRQLSRIKRNLFGPANPVETSKIFAEELEKHQEKAIRKWGFDFRTGTPLSAANSQYIWERVSFQESSYSPELYTLTRAAHVRPAPTTPTPMDVLMDERAERENFLVNTSASADDTDSCDDSHDEAMVVFKVPNVVGRTSTAVALSCARATLCKRQPKITEYMKERKRLAQTPKKVSPAKRMRTTIVSTQVHSITSHFTLQRRN